MAASFAICAVAELLVSFDINRQSKLVTRQFLNATYIFTNNVVSRRQSACVVASSCQRGDQYDSTTVHFSCQETCCHLASVSIATTVTRYRTAETDRMLSDQSRCCARHVTAVVSL